VQVPASPSPAIALEIALLDAALSGVPPAAPKVSAARPEPKVMPEEVQAPEKPAIQIDTKKEIEQSVAEAQEQPAQKELVGKATAPVKATTIHQPEHNRPNTDLPEADADMLLTDKAWEIILGALKQKYSTLYSIVKMAQPHFEPGKVVLELAFAFHQKRLNEARNKQILSEMITGVTGSDVQISTIIGEGRPAPPPPPLPPADGEMVHNVGDTAPEPAVPAGQSASVGDVEAISNIFGGAELLES
jgi:hypothetical protein